MKDEKKIIPITNAIMFAKVMSDKNVCKRVLETLLEIEIDHLEDVEVEHTFDVPDEAKGVRFDVFVKNETRVFDIEMQMVNTGELPLRARYYQSICDISTLKRGESYSGLKQSYIIFLCNFDLTGDGEVCYVVESACNGVVTPKYNDKCRKLFFNFRKFENCDNIETSALLEFFATSRAKTDLTDLLNELVIENSSNETWRNAMTFEIYVEDCKFAAREEGLREGLAEGREQGIKEQQNKIAIAMLEKGMDAGFICEVTGLSAEDIATLKQQ